MKTIEEAAKKYSELFEHKEAHRISFLNGVEFAQRWIPVEEDLPKADDFSVNIEMKLDNNVVLSGYLFADGDFMAYDQDGFGNKITKKVTHWRPIELS